MEKCYFKSSIGILEIVCKNDALVSLRLVESFAVSGVETDFIKNVKKQLGEYFLGERNSFDIKISYNGSDFQMKVWNELRKIPYGKKKSYSEIAAAIGKPNAQRAVGSACNKNPIMIIIPCHRVISKNGKLGGFAYGNDVKEKLLKLET